MKKEIINNLQTIYLESNPSFNGATWIINKYNKIKILRKERCAKLEKINLKRDGLQNK